jgi:hypothetical protein
MGSLPLAVSGQLIYARGVAHWAKFGVLGLLVAFCFAFGTTATAKTPPPVNCNVGPECLVRTLIKYSGTPPPADGSKEYPVTVSGQLQSTGLGGVCQGHRKVILDLSWTLFAGDLGSQRVMVKSDASNRFSHTFQFKVPPPPPAVEAGGPPREYAVTAFVVYELRTYKGKRVACDESVSLPSKGWVGTPRRFPYE